MRNPVASPLRLQANIPLLSPHDNPRGSLAGDLAAVPVVSRQDTPSLTQLVNQRPDHLGSRLAGLQLVLRLLSHRRFRAVDLHASQLGSHLPSHPLSQQGNQHHNLLLAHRGIPLATLLANPAQYRRLSLRERQ